MKGSSQRPTIAKHGNMKPPLNPKIIFKMQQHLHDGYPSDLHDAPIGKKYSCSSLSNSQRNPSNPDKPFSTLGQHKKLLPETHDPSTSSTSNNSVRFEKLKKNSRSTNYVTQPNKINHPDRTM